MGRERRGLLLSYIGKLPGLAIRLALVLSCLNWTTKGEVEAHEATADEFDRATLFVETYTYGFLVLDMKNTHLHQ